ncbi:MAG: response regulator transcription factor [Spirochaetaceae bacterium]|jgi:DNA-binding NarL/FixJ family response regulator|nr:response regulator transcription factor [Spirochaetaceae bacterium]
MKNPKGEETKKYDKQLAVYDICHFCLLFQAMDMSISILCLSLQEESRMVRLAIAMKGENELNHTAIALDAIADFSVVGAASDSYRILRLIESEQPDIAILDYHLDQISGPDLVPTIKHRSPGTSVIIISPYDDENHAWTAMSRGVSGYIVRKYDMGTLTGIIHVVHKGGLYISPRIVTQILPQFHRYQKIFRNINFMKNKKVFVRPKAFFDLSHTDQQILEFMSQGKTTKEIAENMNLKTGTIRNYISVMMKKTGVHNRAQLICFALFIKPAE